MFAGDIFASQRQLSGLLKGNTQCSAKVVNEIGLMIKKFTSDTFIPVEYSEKLLTTTGNLMEKCTEEESMEFASCRNFTDALISIVDDFNKRIVPTQSSHNQSSFSSHYCYELSLFMLLGLLDKTTLLVAFVKATSVHRINECIQSICSTILHDHLYLTQEVGLEIVCRISHYFLQRGSAAFEEVIAGVSPVFRSAVNEPKKIPSLLRDMRSLLNGINASNPSVFSLPMRCFSVGTNWKKIDTQRDVHSDGWMDLCKNDVCYNLLEKEVLLRFHYQAIKKVHFSEETNAVQVLLHECPKKLKDLLRKDELPPRGQSPVLVFEFASTDKEVMQNVRAVLEARMIEHETVKEDGQKYSVVSSRDQSPSAVAQALDRLRQCESVRAKGSGPNFVSPRSKTSSTAQHALAAEGKPSAHEESPSSISSPDMDVPSVNTSQEHLKDHKPGPDSLANLPMPSTSKPAQKPASGARGNSAERKRQTTTDALAFLSMNKKRAVSAAPAPKALTTVRKRKVARSPVQAKNSTSSDERDRGKAKDMPVKLTATGKKGKQPVGIAAGRDKENAPSFKVVQAVAPAFEADDFGFDAGAVSVEKAAPPAPKTPLRALNSSDLNARRPPVSAQTAPRSTARMRAPTGNVPVAAPLARGDENAPARYDSPAVSQAGTHSSKRKFGRAIEPVMEDDQIAWRALNLPPSPEKSKTERPAATREKDSLAKPKVPLKQALTTSKKRDPPQSKPSEQKTFLFPQSITAARMHATLRVPAADEPPSPSPVRRHTARLTKVAEDSEQDTPKHKKPKCAEHVRGSPPQDASQADMPYYENAGFADDTPYDAVVDISFAADSKTAVPHAPTPVEDHKGNTWRRPGPLAPKAPLENRLVSSMATQLEATRAQLKRAVGGKWVDPVEDDADVQIPETQPVATFAQGLADTWRAASQVSLTSRATGSAYHSTQEEDAWATTTVPAVAPAAAAAAKSLPRAPASPAATRTRRGRRKRSAIELDSEDQGDAEEDAYLSKMAVAEHSGSEDPSGSSLEENDIVAALLREIISMQKERAKRKRARILASIGSTAKTQVVSFLAQWQAFAEHSSGEMQRGVNAQLEHLCATADTLCEALRQDAELYGAHDQEMGQDLQALEKEAVALKTELGSAQNQFRNEVAKARNDVAALRGRALDAAKKTISMHKDTRQHSSKLQSMELLKALRET